MSANKPEDQEDKQTGSNKNAEKEVRDFDPDGQNSQRKGQQTNSNENPEVES